MLSRELEVRGAFAFQPVAYADERGEFVTAYQRADFVAALGHPLFPVAQASQSTSRRGVVRGLHYTLAPPGTAKYVRCVRGRALDLVVDLRLGSPTFRRVDQVELSGSGHCALYLPPGVGHAFVALEDDTVISYLLSEEYEPRNELALSVLDPELGLPLPRDLELVLSERDRAAPTFAQAAERGLLPDHAACEAVRDAWS
ncbi:dTDP-4-dehydrorhamnose 3,5-epimerase family protein [Nonomuraea sp. NPDC049400]|uniref:dTDP-4-dehydrorhamnose 3,5-epimerase family protein n=1 Tax=Nonomuraea sp. NPDC049400 TaxID=3364352 RepID=UPI00378A7C45